MNLEGLLHHGNILVKELADGINCRGLSFEESERQILQFLYQIGQALEEQVVAGLKEPTTENRTRVNGKIAVFDGRRPLRFRSRFGGQTVILRRCYKYSDEPGGWYPIDEKLGLDRCLGYSPLMSYLIASFGASEPYGRASQLLSEALGFTLSATAIQRNTEAAGQRIGDNPHQLISASKAQESCEVMVVEVDGTISPQITEKQGVSGRESLKLPTEWKQCNVAVIEKYRHGKPFDRWMGARYGKQQEFEPYVGRAAIAMGQHTAAKVVFLADGAHANWELQSTNFPGAVAILDFYHASEHLGDFCSLLRDQRKAAGLYARWRHMLLEGQILQVIQEMRRRAERTNDRHAAIGQINYFRNNVNRMDYESYKQQGFPIGSGLVEGSCKFIVAKRFKGSGMRWKRQDNSKVLRARLEKLNGNLHKYFKPSPQNWLPYTAAA
jgi:hypothetical protein